MYQWSVDRATTNILNDKSVDNYVTVIEAPHKIHDLCFELTASELFCILGLTLYGKSDGN